MTKLKVGDLVKFTDDFNYSSALVVVGFKRHWFKPNRVKLRYLNHNDIFSFDVNLFTKVGHLTKLELLIYDITDLSKDPKHW